jgi:arginine N-succinyltransferase
MRRAKIEDTGTLLKLARMVHFINLPADRDIIADKIMRSRESFLKAAELDSRVRAGGTGASGGGPAEGREGGPADLESASGRSSGGGLAALTKLSHLFMFVMEDTTSGGVLGTSQIISRMGGPGHPNVSFQLSRKEMFSSTLQVGATHIVAKLLLDETGPTEIGGLILQSSYRGHRLRLGRFLSLVRFHVIGLYRPMFADRVLAEMMGPITPDGRNTLWEYLGRRFINLTYTEADRFCQFSKEFMTSLLPREEIYITLLPPEARAVIAQVGPETEPAKRMLEKLGFEYRDRIDPFDGGPHLEAATDAISLVRNTIRANLGPPRGADAHGSEHGMVSVLDGDGEFRAVEADYERDHSGRVRLSRSDLKLLGAEPGMPAGLTPLGEPGAGAGAGESRKGRAARNGEAAASTRAGTGSKKGRPKRAAARGGASPGDGG